MRHYQDENEFEGDYKWTLNYTWPYIPWYLEVWLCDENQII